MLIYIYYSFSDVDVHPSATSERGNIVGLDLVKNESCSLFYSVLELELKLNTEEEEKRIIQDRLAEVQVRM